MLKPAKRLKIGATFGVENAFTATGRRKIRRRQSRCRLRNRKRRKRRFRQRKNRRCAASAIHRPRPARADYDRDFDNRRYETVYADPSKRVAAAAPTAGLHFTPELIKTLESRGNRFFDLTLHVGIGTFQPLKSDIVEEHKMHAEIYEIPAATLRAMADQIRAEARRRHDIAEGNGGLRTEAPRRLRRRKARARQRKPFRLPAQRIRAADAMITNFHLPRSTLMCLVAVFLKPDSRDGVEKLKEIYRAAIEREYNFYSYGDAMLIL